MLPPIPASWRPVLAEEVKKPYYQKLQEFLDHERVTARALRHEHEGRTRWPLALDPFDQVRKVAPPQRIERQPRRLPSRLDHLGDASREWV